MLRFFLKEMSCTADMKFTESTHYMKAKSIRNNIKHCFNSGSEYYFGAGIYGHEADFATTLPRKPLRVLMFTETVLSDNWNNTTGNPLLKLSVERDLLRDY